MTRVPVRRPADGLGRHPQAPLVVAAVVDRADRVHPGKLVRRHHVHRAQLDRVSAEPPGQLVHHPFVGEVDLRLAVAAVGADRGLVGDHDAPFHEAVLHLVRPVEHDRGQLGGPERRVQPAEVVGVDVAHGQDPAVRACGDLVIVHRLPAVRGGAEMLVPVLGELDRAAQRDGVQAGQQVFGVGAELEPEAAPHVQRHHPDVGFVDPQRLRELGTDQVRRLGRGVHGQRARARPPFGQHRAGLHRQPGDPVDVEPALDDDVGLLDPGGHVAAALRVAHQQIGFKGTRVDDRGAGRHGREHVGHVGEWLVLDLDQFQRVLGHMPAGGRDADHRLALVSGGLLDQREMRDHGRPGYRPHDPDRPAARGDLRAGIDLENAIERQRGRRVDAHDAGVRVGAAADCHLGRVSRVDVVRELARATQQAVVLLARDVGAQDGPLALHRPGCFTDAHVSHRRGPLPWPRDEPRRRSR